MSHDSCVFKACTSQRQLIILFSFLCAHRLNYKMLAFLGSLLLVAMVNAQRPEPCETPDEWTGRVMTIDPSKDVAVFGRMSYDAIGERVSIVEEVDYKKGRKFYEFIFLHKEGTMYQIELSINKTGSCVKKDLTEPFHKFAIPKNATSVGLATIGSNAGPGLGVNVALFIGEMDEDRYYVSVTEEGCIPVHEGVESKKFGYMHTSFYDIEEGYDPERFVPPHDCE